MSHINKMSGVFLLATECWWVDDDGNKVIFI